MLKGICVNSGNIEKAAQAGFDYIILPGFEIAAMDESEFDSVCRRVWQTDIPVAGYNAYCKDSLPIVGDDFDPEKTTRYAHLLCERGHRLGIKNIGIGAPLARRLPDGYDIKKAYAQGKKFIELTASEAEKYNFNVLVEGLHKNCCNFINYLPEAYQLMQDINRHNVKMVVDFYHMQVNGEDFESALGFLDYCGDIHISGCDENLARPFVSEMDSEMLKKIASVLKKGGYSTSVSLESDMPKDGFDDKAKKAYKAINRYFV
ncbi:sugar phosphate isomerase/epimerase [Lachnospiraceae bacterium NSJ-143]|nr:sugar phosphate isomerase/epimerase [Lachnospiraceae bacterium NSJ-143]